MPGTSGNIADACTAIAGALGETLELRVVFQRVATAVRGVIPFDRMGVSLLLAPQTARTFAMVGEGADLTENTVTQEDYSEHMWPRDEHVTLVRIVDSNVELDPAYPADRRAIDQGYRSQLISFLESAGRRIGVLWFQAHEPDTFTDAHVEMLPPLANLVTLAIEHERLAEESRANAALRERAANLEMLDGLLGALTGVLDVREVFQRVSEIASKVLPHDAMGLPILTDDREHFIPLATIGLPSQMVPPGIQPLPDDQKYLLNNPWDFEIVDDLKARAEFVVNPFTRSGQRAMLRVPIRLDGRVEGVLAFFSRTPGAYSQADTLIARRIADHVALVISHQRLADESRRTAALRERSANLALLDALLAALTDKGELREASDRISDIAQTVLTHDAMALGVLLDDGAHVRFYVSKAPPGATLPDVVETPEHLRRSDWEFEIVGDLQADARQRGLWAAGLGFRSALRVPIRIDGQLAAGIGFFSFTPSLYSEADVAIARRVADRLAISLLRERGIEAARRADEASARVSRLESRVQALTEELNARAGFHRVIGRSATWRQVLTQATQVAATETTVLLLGESGTGKEVVARFLHRASARKGGPFVALNCAALPEQLLESELFGYERGAFTGAMNARAGKIEQAAGGVLFLDEVGEMTTPVQAKFLRVLQEREFQRLGGTKTLKADVRVVAATNRDPKQAMERGAMREDLYYRLSVFEIALPPLRERKDDILLLVDAFLAELAKSVGRPAGGVSEDARDRLLAYHWPGNVRELRNAIERAVILCDGGLITSEHLPVTLGQMRPPPPAAALAIESVASFPAEGMTLESVERDLLRKALAKAGNNKSQAAKLLGLPRGQFYSLLKRHGLTDAKR
jgi:two-component system NtrC family response regulator